MDWLSLVGLLGGAAGWAAFGVTALRMSGLKTDALEADLLQEDQEKELEKLADKFEEYKKRTKAQLEDLKNEIEDLERQRLGNARPGDIRIALNSLLQKASAASRDA
jgi:cell division protein FtsB